MPHLAHTVNRTAWTERLRGGLARTRAAIGGGLDSLLGRGALDEAVFVQIEDALLAADCGVATTSTLIARLREQARRERIDTPAALRAALKQALIELLAPLERPFEVARAKPFVVMMAGVNGSGKTTSIGKLARWLQDQNRSVLLAAGDTFRAAAREQLVEWGRRNNVPVIAQLSADPGAVVYDAVNAARARGTDVVIADTAGRLPTQLHLMEEVKKVKRVLGKALEGAPHEILLVLDANTGQNALAQVSAFDEALGLTGLLLTKLDGTAKGGIVCAIAQARGAAGPAQRAALPLYFVGTGEGIDDLHPFVAREFVDALID